MTQAPQQSEQLVAALRFVYALLAPGQDANSILQKNPTQRQQAHRAVWQALQELKAAHGPAGYALDYDRDINPDWTTPNQCSAADQLDQMWDQMVHWDFLLPGKWLPPVGPTRSNWLGQRIPIPVDGPLQQWAGEIARARVLMDLKAAAKHLRQQAQNTTD